MTRLAHRVQTLRPETLGNLSSAMSDAPSETKKTDSNAELAKPPSRLRRWGKRLGITLLVLLAVIMVVSNIFLRTRLFRNLMAFDPEAMTMEYTSAYSWFPGRVHVENLQIRGSDSHVQWLLTVDHADTFIEPLEFAKQRIHAWHCSADGVTFHVRTRYAPEDITPELMDALPKIPGLADPPLKIPVPPPPSDKDYNLWGADLEEVTADHVRDIWIDTLRAQGDVHLTGRWLFRPIRELDFGPSVIEIHRMDVVNGKYPLADDVHGQVTLRIFDFDVRKPQGLDILDQFSATAKLAAEVPLSDGLDKLLGSKNVKLSDGRVALSTDVRVDHGVIGSGSRVQADLSETKIKASLGSTQLAVRTALFADFKVDETSTLVGKLRTKGLVVSKPGAPAATADVQTEMTTKNLRLAHGFDDAAFHVHATDVKTSSAERWIFPDDKNSLWATGAVNADADFDVTTEPSHLHGSLYFAVSDATIAHDSLRITTDLKGEAKVEDASTDNDSVDAIVDFETPRPITTALGSAHMTSTIAAHVRVKAHAKPALRADFSGTEIHWRNAVADLDSSQKLRLFSAPEITVRAPKAVVTDSGMSGSVDVDMPRADSGDIAALHGVLPLPDTIRIVGGTANANLHATLDLATLTGHGDLNVLAQRLDVRIDKSAVFGNLALALHAVRANGGTTDLSGSTVTFARSDAPDAPRSAEPWSARFEMQQATLVSSPSPYFCAVLRGMATDASPATIFVSGATGIPNWLTNAFTMRGLSVGAGILVAPSRIEIQSLDARGDNAFVQMEYMRMGSVKDGAIYIGTGPFAAGIDLAGGGARLVLFGPQSWFKDDVAKIRRNESSPVTSY